MRSAQRIYVQILRLLLDTEQSMGLESGLTEKDRVVLLYLHDQRSKEGEEIIRANFDDFVHYLEQQDSHVSRTQFFTSLKKLEKLEFLQKVGSPRSARYKLL